MNARLLRCSLFVLILPIGTTLWMLDAPPDGGRTLLVLLAALGLQLLVLRWCKKQMEPFIHPDPRLLRHLGVSCVPMAYQPGRFRADVRVCSVGLWLSSAAPVFTWLAFQLPRPHDMMRSLGPLPNADLLLFAAFAILFGGLVFPFWFAVSRAAALYAEGSDQKRYLQRGFLDVLENQRGAGRTYLAACRYYKKHPLP